MEGSTGEVGLTRKNLLKTGAAAVAAGAAALGIKKLTSESPPLPAGVERVIADGVEVLKSGNEGPNIIFLHNAGQVPEGMTEHMLNLSEVGQVVAPNIFDLIRSLQLKGNKHPSFADIANEFSRLDLLDKKQKTGIVSSSFGSSVAWEYTAQNPDEVEWNVAGSPTGWPLKRSLVEWMGAFAREFFLPQKVPIPENTKKRDPGSGMMVKRFLQHPKSVLQGLKLTMNAEQKETMQTIKSPVDLLWGRTDQYIPPWTNKMVADVFPTNGRLTIASEYNHLWLAVEPDLLTNPALARAKATPPKAA